MGCCRWGCGSEGGSRGFLEVVGLMVSAVEGKRRKDQASKDDGRRALHGELSR